MLRRVLIVAFSIFALGPTAMLSAQKKDVNYDEAKVPEYSLPNPLIMNDGSVVKSQEQWPARRAEIMAICRREMYGQAPGPPKKISFERVDNDENALGGKAIRRQVVMHIGDCLLYTSPSPRDATLSRMPSSA